MSKPDWLKKQWKPTEDMARVEELVADLGLNTVCREASCPNYCDCFSRGTATFMILGANCTRSCGFCGVTHAEPESVDPGEATRVAEAVQKLALHYVVITSVTRDDLGDGGASEFARTVREIRRLSPETKIETLIPDLEGDEAALDLILEAAPDVISHNIETVKELYGKVRPQADYERSLRLLSYIAGHKRDGSFYVLDRTQKEPSLLCPKEPSPLCKSGLMVGVGETDGQVRKTIDDLLKAGCSILTIGQYLRPSEDNIPVEEYIEPEVFDRWAEYARGAGFSSVASAPFVRSSYHAEEALSDPL